MHFQSSSQFENNWGHIEPKFYTHHNCNDLGNLVGLLFDIWNIYPKKGPVMIIQNILFEAILYNVAKPLDH